MWQELLLDSGLNEREVNSIMILGSNPRMKASELAKELNTTRLDAQRHSFQEPGHCVGQEVELCHISVPHLVDVIRRVVFTCPREHTPEHRLCR